MFSYLLYSSSTNEERKRGYLRGKVPPETLTENSFLIRSSYTFDPVKRDWIGHVIHALYIKAGLLQKNSSKRYTYRGHSLRKFFKTQQNGAERP